MRTLLLHNLVGYTDSYTRAASCSTDRNQLALLCKKSSSTSLLGTSNAISLALKLMTGKEMSV